MGYIVVWSPHVLVQKEFPLQQAVCSVGTGLASVLSCPSGCDLASLALKNVKIIKVDSKINLKLGVYVPLNCHGHISTGPYVITSRIQIHHNSTTIKCHSIKLVYHLISEFRKMIITYNTFLINITHIKVKGQVILILFTPFPAGLTSYIQMQNI